MSQSDLDQIASCKKYSGNIEIANSNVGNLNLAGIQELDGDLTINNCTSLGSFTAPNLKTIDGEFYLQSLTSLGVLNCPQLSSVDSIKFITLPALQQLQFGSTINKSEDIYISDTSLTSLEGINVDKVASFNLNNNKYLNEVDVALTSVSDSLDISFNSAKVVATFSQLKWANNMTFRDVSSISLPNVTVVNASLGFINNSISSLSMPQLTQVGGSLSIVSNSKAGNVSFPQLKNIGGAFVIANNTNLKSVTGFPKVEQVGGAIDFVGSFDEASLPKLDLVKGGVIVDSSSSKFNCSSWNEAHSNGDIHGDSYMCKAKKVSTSVAIDTATMTNSHTAKGAAATSATNDASATHHSNSKGAAAASGLEMTSLVGALAAFIFQFV